MTNTWKPNLITKLVTSAYIAASAVIGVSAPAEAMSERTRYNHRYLLEAVVATGVEVRINQAIDCHPKYNDGENYFGSYNGRRRELAICQEDLMQTNNFQGQVINFTNEDLDTLRHEAHHLVQDCMDNNLNSELHYVYDDPMTLAANTLTERHARTIVKGYAERGEHVVRLELEAFSVAAMNDPLEQVRDINRFCLGR